MKAVIFLVGAFLVLNNSYILAKEHGGSGMHEHAGKPAKNYTAKDIKNAITEHVKHETPNGVFTFKDYDDNDKTLELNFVKIHDPVRKLESKKAYFACTDFNVVGEKDKLYDMDFWLEDQDGKLVVTKTKIHKQPELVATKWVKKERYTFKGDEIVLLKK